LNTTGLNTEQKVVGREQDSRETEREGERRERGREDCSKREMSSVIKLAVEKIFMTDIEG
jgi:hypothetical protein